MTDQSPPSHSPSHTTEPKERGISRLNFFPKQQKKKDSEGSSLARGGCNNQITSHESQSPRRKRLMFFFQRTSSSQKAMSAEEGANRATGCDLDEEMTGSSQKAMSAEEGANRATGCDLDEEMTGETVLPFDITRDSLEKCTSAARSTTEEVTPNSIEPGSAIVSNNVLEYCLESKGDEEEVDSYDDVIAQDETSCERPTRIMADQGWNNSDHVPFSNASINSRDNESHIARRVGAFEVFGMASGPDGRQRTHGDGIPCPLSLNNIPDLATARAVDDIDWPIVSASEVLADEQSLKKRRLPLYIPRVCCALLLVLALGMAVQRHQFTVSRTPAFPSYSPSVGPSLSPSAAPSVALDDLLDALPDYSLESLDDPFSDQSRALDWLVTHKDLPDMEVWRKTQLFALATLYYAMGGPTWIGEIGRDWLDDKKHECVWFSSDFGYFEEDGTYVDLGDDDLGEGISYHCPNDSGKYENLILVFLEPPSGHATLPNEIGLLTDLWSLFLGGMVITGSIPTRLRHLTDLRLLKLMDNGLSGSIPSELGLITSLTWLELFSNSLVGKIPSEAGGLTNLSILSLAHNTLTGEIPSEIGLVYALSNLDLRDDGLSGILPSELGTMEALAMLDLRDNSFSGLLPSELGLMNVLSSLWIYGNAISGTLPTEMGEMGRLERLFASRNQWAGPLPTELVLMTALRHLDLSWSSLDGQVPSELGLLVANSGSLESLDIRQTELSGAIPDKVCLMLNQSSCVTSGWIPQPCVFQFDCTDTLCGCGCTC